MEVVLPNLDNVPFLPNARFDKTLTPEDMQLLQQQWNILNELRKVRVDENPILKRKELGGTDLPQGTLIHGTSFDLEKLRQIADLGIVSGELVGIPEDNETHYCADFFRVPENMTVSEYLEWCSKPITKGILRMKRGEFNYLPMPIKSDRQIAFIFDTSDTRLEPLLKYDAYDPAANEKMQNIINILPRDVDPSPSRTTSAILAGIPGNFISGLIISELITEPEVEEVKSIFKGLPIFRVSGEIVSNSHHGRNEQSSQAEE